MRNVYRFEILVALLAAGAGFAAAQGVPMNCTADFTVCYIPKNVLVVNQSFPLIAGDAVIQKAGSTEPVAVFRVNNDFDNTARGTGMGAKAFLYSVDGTARLPNPSTYSANVQYVSIAASGPTPYTGAPIIPIVYQLDLGAAPVDVRYTGATMAGSSGSVQLSVLVTSGGHPVAGGAVYLYLGAQSCNATTDATGTATCTIVLNQHPGQYDVSAFAGIFGSYAGGTDSKSFIVTGH